MFRQGQWAVHGLLNLLGRNEAAISNRGKIFSHHAVLGPKLIFVTDWVKFVTAVARLVCPDLLGWCLSCPANIYFGPCSSPHCLVSSLQRRGVGLASWLLCHKSLLPVWPPFLLLFPTRKVCTVCVKGINRLTSL